MRPLLTVLMLAGLLAAAATGCTALTRPAVRCRAPGAASRYYLALGDSLSQGVQPDAAGVSQPTQDGTATSSTRCCAAASPGCA